VLEKTACFTYSFTARVSFLYKFISE